MLNLTDFIHILGGGTPKTSIPSYWNGDIPWISITDLDNNSRWIKTTEKSITIEGLNNSSTRLLDAGDIVISARGTVGTLAQLKIPMAFNQSCYGIKAKESLVTQDYLYYLLKKYIHILKKNTHGSVFETITIDTFSNIQLPLPPLSEQKRIANILSSFDNKIEILKKENKILENIAENIFKEWFVKYNFPNKDGKPYRDNNGKMIDSELGSIPDGWRVGKLESIFDFLEGPGIRNWQYRPEGFPFINIRLFTDDHDLDTRNCNFVSLEEAEGKYKHFHLKERDFVISTSGTLGKYAIVQKKDLPLILNTSVIRFRPLNNILYSFMYLYLSSRIFQHELESLASGSVQLNFGPMHLRQIKVVIPNIDTLQAFAKVVDRIYDKILNNKEVITSCNSIKGILLSNIIH